MTRTNREMVQIFLRFCALVPGACCFSCRYALGTLFGPPALVSLHDSILERVLALWTPVTFFVC
uniref:Uncharacterized protein n=1 Tax=Setaria viridis TaxID=4556 RepID=A0A4U6VNH4_SETVI|nr:hypothetical protein SEVIR_2G035866v2 [Setaria viridis]